MTVIINDIPFSGTATVDKTSFPSVILINDIPIDVATMESHSFPSEVTQFPVESGARISDNIRPKPIKITIECLVSNSPLGEIQKLRNAHTKKLSATSSNYARAVYDELVSIYTNRKPVEITTSVDVFQNMVMTELGVPRTSGEPNGLKFTCEFEQVTVIASVRGTVRVSNPICGTGRNLGPKSGTIIAEGRILWRIGSPPGSTNIVLTEWVTLGHYTSPQEAGKAQDVFGNSVFNRSNPGSKDFRSVVRSTGAWTYFRGSGTANNPFSPLTQRELRDFNLDMARDHVGDANGGNTFGNDINPPQQPTRTPLPSDPRSMVYPQNLRGRRGI